MPIRLFQYQNYTEVQRRFKEGEDNTKSDQRILKNKEDFCGDFFRMMKSGDLYIKDKQKILEEGYFKPLFEKLIKEGKIEKEVAKELFGFIKGGKPPAKYYDALSIIFKETLSDHGVKIDKLDTQAANLFILGFHQQGYANAMQNALTLGLGERGFINPSATRAINITQSNDGSIRVTENLGVHLLTKTSNKGTEQQPLTKEQIDEENKRWLEFNTSLNELDSGAITKQEMNSKFPIIANIQTTYSFSKESPMEVRPPVIERYPSKDKHNMLSRLPDERSFWQKLVDKVVDYCFKAQLQPIVPPTHSSTSSKPKA